MGKARPPIRCPWLRELAQGYLRRYQNIEAKQRGGQWGYVFAAAGGGEHAGFFVGFVTRPGRAWPTVLELPACAVYVFATPAGSRLHRKLVHEEGSLFRRGYQLLTKYTNRRPRFSFHEEAEAVVIRHAPLAAFPPREREKYARNFFMETLALLQRSRLPDKLLELAQQGRGQKPAG